MTLKRIFIIFLFIITASHVFSFAFIKDMSDWEDYKFYIMTVQEYNNYNISRGWNRNVLEENP